MSGWLPSVPGANAVCICYTLNETHLQHSDTLTPDMMGLTQDRFIVHYDHNNRGGGVALIVNTNLNPKQIRMNTMWKLSL